MKYRQRQEKVNGESPYVDVKVSGDGTTARVKVLYSRTVRTKDLTTTTFGELHLGDLDPDDLACVGRTVLRAQQELAQKHWDYVQAGMDSMREML